MDLSRDTPPPKNLLIELDTGQLQALDGTEIHYISTWDGSGLALATDFFSALEGRYFTVAHISDSFKYAGLRISIH